MLAVAGLLVSLNVVIQAFGAGTSAEFERWAGWANVWALPASVAALVPLVWEKVRGSKAAASEVDEVKTAEEALAKVMLKRGQEARARLLGIDAVGDQAINVRFVKETSWFREAGGARDGDLDSVLEYYLSLSPRRLVILGDAGGGKTGLALELVIRLLEERAQEGEGVVPVLISASAWNVAAWPPFEEWLARHLARRFGMGQEVAARLVRDRRVLPVVDGLDELDTAGPPARARAAIEKLNAYISGRERAPVVVTCRRAEYEQLKAGLDRATHVEMVALTGHQAAAYVRVQVRDAPELRAWALVLAELEAHPGGLVAAELATPWRLMLALMVFRDGGDPAELLPDASEVVAVGRYRKRVDEVLLGRYVPAVVRLHDADGRYSLSQVQHWLTALAAGLAWQARHGGSATDIELHEWWRPVGRWRTRLGHAGVATLPAIAWLITVGSSHDDLQVIGVLLMVVGVLMSLMPGNPNRLDVRGLATRAALRHIHLKLTSRGLTMGTPALALPAWVEGEYVLGLSSWLAAWLVGGLVGGLLDGLRDPSPQAIGPRDLIRADGHYGLTIELAFVLLIWFIWFVPVLVGAPLVVPIWHGTVLAIGLTIGVSVASGVWVRYHVAVVLAAFRGQAPLRFGAFLDWAHQAGLLRVSGTAYQFRHRQLQDWFTPAS